MTSTRLAVVLAAWSVVGCSSDLENGRDPVSFGTGGSFGVFGLSEADGVCLGSSNIPIGSSEGSWCSKHHRYDRARCLQVEGCEWTETGAEPAGGYCWGYAVACTRYRPEECGSQPGCTWYGPQRCNSDETCLQSWLVEDGACAEVGDSVHATCTFEPRRVIIDFARHCRGEASTPGFCE